MRRASEGTEPCAPPLRVKEGTMKDFMLSCLILAFARASGTC